LNQKALIQSKATAYKAISDLTGQQPSDTLLDFIYYTNLLNSKNSTILVGIEDAQLSVLKQSGKGY